MKIRHLWLFALGVIMIVSMNSCTKTVVQTTVDSVKVIDTVRDKVGLCEVRFVCMFPQFDASQINIYAAGDSHNPILLATNNCPNTYFPVRSDTTTTFYVNIPTVNNWYDSVPLPPPGPTMNTCAMFLNNNGQGDSSFTYTWSNDSEKFTPPPSGHSYIRLINSVADATGPFFVDLDMVGDSIVFPHAQSQALPAFSISDYALIPSGQHHIYLRPSFSNIQQPPAFSTVENFEDGQYYTIVATGPSPGLIHIDKE
jgi:hypothetical protein